MRRRLLPVLALALTMPASATPAAADVVPVRNEGPRVTVDVPKVFEVAKSDRGIFAKTADGEVYVWFETYALQDGDVLIREHDAFWATNRVERGRTVERSKSFAGGRTIVATDYKHATWRGKPTVLRYLSIDPALPSKTLILMSLWASPEGDKAHDAEVMDMVGSLKIQK